MAERGPFILIGDADGKRSEFLVQILKEEFQATALTAKTYDGLVGQKKTRDKWHAILIAEDLPRSNLDHNPNLVAALNHLWMPSPDIPLGCISDSPDAYNRPGIDFLVHHIYVSPSTPTTQSRDHLVSQFAGLLPHVPPLPVVSLVDDPILREQLRSLDEDRKLAKAERLIGRLTEAFFHCDQVKVGRLTQGWSDASVFQIDLSKNGRLTGHFVLKLCPRKFAWKLREEAKRHRAAGKNFTFNYIRSSLPKLRGSRYSVVGEPSEISFSGDWAALCMDFVGGDDVIDIETALTASRQDLIEKARRTSFEAELQDPGRLQSVRLKLLDDVFLEWLHKEWYEDGTRVIRDSATPTKLWVPSDAPAEEYITFPPYRLTGRTKGYILSFLDGRETLQGNRLFDSWAQHHQAVRDFVVNENNLTHITALDEEAVVTLAPVHGDLNANNILLWLRHPDQPFLIDFPFYQELGHVVQDFASLEAAIKFGLMDRQLNDLSQDPQALDYTHSQVELWLEMEDWLLSDEWGAEKDSWVSAGENHNVQLSLEFVQAIRQRAYALQQQTMGPEVPTDFDREYMPGLLYHTLRAISYTNLSVFKRLLAVVSASRIVQRI